MLRSSPSFNLATLKAKGILEELTIKNPSEIAINLIASYKDAFVREAKLTGCDGRLSRKGKHGIITVRSDLHSIRQKRFVVAHELGHFLLHPEICQIDSVDSKQTRNYNHNQRPEELEANYFAAELLIPTKFLKSDLRERDFPVPSWDLIRELAKVYQTTLSSLAIQFTRCTDEPVFLIASDNRKRSWFFISNSAQGLFLKDDEYVSRSSCTHELFHSNESSIMASNVPAAAWLEGYRLGDKECVTEHAIKARDSSFALTLVWINEEI